MFRSLGFFIAIFLLSGCAAYGPPRSAGEKIIPNLVFANPAGKPLRMDLYIPKTAKPAPVVLWIFGGSWKFGSRAFHVNLRNLTQQGIAIAAIDYRLTGTAIYPAQLEDCQSAVAWLRQNGATYGLDPNKIGASGESAGGHLAALLGTVEGRGKIKAVCALYPPTDLVSLGYMYADAEPQSDIERLLGGPIEQRLKIAREASPLDRVTRNSPPFLLIHGAKDPLVPLEQSQKLDERLRKSGVPSRLIVVPNKEHWFLLSEEQVREVGDFFRLHFAM